MVAEDIAIGDRVFWNLVQRPDLPTSGFDAIEELHKKGLVTASLRENRVEPTEAFWPWLEELQLAEAQQAAAQQTNAVLPGRQSLPSPDPAPPILPFASPEGAVGLPHAPVQALIKPRRAQVNRPDLEHVDQMCVRILDFMNHNGHRLPLSTIRRGLNAYRCRDLFNRALRRLQNRRAIMVDKEPATRREWVTLQELPQKYRATKLPPKRRRHAPHSRGQTFWFQALMAERELED